MKLLVATGNQGKAREIRRMLGDLPYQIVTLADLDNPPETIPVGDIQAGTATGKYVCSICGYVYDPSVGDPDRGIAPGTAFADLPEDWRCPRCRQGKDKFNEA